ncbi:hypothetical protein EX30DRAFT_340866 [Ascodesmis nigricans]|uniref:Uncharacterized protein n=1 Tax=Ascodesmis nigricans TaxID=341454 RepID=A0A4S2MX35_9PEZI|nr:hypothetical protein EX30DRAFT_340866 [Ascodesmis nigricans]
MSKRTTKNAPQNARPQTRNHNNTNHCANNSNRNSNSNDNDNDDNQRGRFQFIDFPPFRYMESPSPSLSPERKPEVHADLPYPTFYQPPRPMENQYLDSDNIKSWDFFYDQPPPTHFSKPGYDQYAVSSKEALRTKRKTHIGRWDFALGPPPEGLFYSPPPSAAPAPPVVTTVSASSAASPGSTVPQQHLDIPITSPDTVRSWGWNTFHR